MLLPSKNVSFYDANSSNGKNLISLTDSSITISGTNNVIITHKSDVPFSDPVSGTSAFNIRNPESLGIKLVNPFLENAKLEGKNVIRSILQ